ncbi:MAG: response regulator [Caulobacter sp.]
METTVLIVDDSKLARIVVAKALDALQPDWVRVEASSAEEALDVINRQQIDVALVDYNMAGMDGLALVEEIRARFPQMPIAVATANIQDEIITRARAVDAAFIAKPVTQDGLRGFVSGAALRLRAAK